MGSPIENLRLRPTSIRSLSGCQGRRGRQSKFDLCIHYGVSAESPSCADTGDVPCHLHQPAHPRFSKRGASSALFERFRPVSGSTTTHAGDKMGKKRPRITRPQPQQGRSPDAEQFARCYHLESKGQASQGSHGRAFEVAGRVDLSLRRYRFAS